MCHNLCQNVLGQLFLQYWTRWNDGVEKGKQSLTHFLCQHILHFFMTHQPTMSALKQCHQKLQFSDVGPLLL